MENLISNLPDDFPCCIWIYNNIFKTTKHDTYANYLVQINELSSSDFKFITYWYVKVLLIQKILSFSGEFLDINYNLCKNDNCIPDKDDFVEYVNETNLLIIKNRKAIHHHKTNTAFINQILNAVHSKFSGLIVNVLIVTFFDTATCEIK
jgi:hypothetical protein